jgi:hypothetical protein
MSTSDARVSPEVPNWSAMNASQQISSHSSSDPAANSSLQLNAAQSRRAELSSVRNHIASSASITTTASYSTANLKDPPTKRSFTTKDNGDNNQQDTQGGADGLDAELESQQLVFDEGALFCLSTSNPLRKAFIWLITQRWFDGAILFVILVNCAFLASYDPTGKDRDRNHVVETSNYAFTGIFAAEMVCRVIAMGFLFSKHAYLRNPWNRLDFVVVISGFIEIFVDAEISAIRAVRVLRPLRSITTIPQLQIITNTLLSSVRQLADAFALFVFFFSFFALAGLQLFQGILHQRCYSNTTGELEALPDDNLDARCSLLSGMGRSCPQGYSCFSRSENPNYGVTSFDNMGWSLLLVFQCTTMEGWSDIMYMVQNAFAGSSAIFFVLIIFLGSFFTLNLALAVINDIFEKQSEREEELQERREELAREKAGSNAKPGGLLGNLLANATFIMVAERRKSLHSLSQTIEAMSTGTPQDANSTSTEKTSTDVTPVGTLSQPTSVSSKALKLQSPQRQASPRFKKRYCTGAPLLRRLVNHKIFESAVLVLIILNTIVLAMDYYNSPEEYDRVLTIFNYVFTSIFAAEVLLKIAALGPVDWVHEKFNIFDFVVVALSIIEIFADGVGSGFTALRALRLLRIFRLARSWNSLRNLMETLVRASASVSWLCLLLLLLIFIYALMGMSFFGGNYDFADGKPRNNYDTIWMALITDFQVLTGENWNNIMYDSVRATSWGAAFYYICLVCTGNYLVLNLFIAILLGNVSETREMNEAQDAATAQQADAKEEDAKPVRSLSTLVAKLSSGRISNDADSDSRSFPSLSRRGSSKMYTTSLNDIAGNAAGQQLSPRQEGSNVLQLPSSGTSLHLSSHVSRKTTSTKQANNDTCASPTSQSARKYAYAPSLIVISHQGEDHDTGTVVADSGRDLGEHVELSSVGEEPESDDSDERQVPPQDNPPSAPKSNWLSKTFPCLSTTRNFALGFMSPANPVRAFAARVVGHWLFELTTLLLILLSAVTLAMENPRDDPNSEKSQVLEIINLAVTCAFAVEMLLKIIAMGLVMHADSYLRSRWNCLDGCITVVSIVSLVVTDDSSLTVIKVVRLMRVLRPLRLISKSAGMRVVVDTLLAAIPQVLSVIMIWLLLFVIFGILGVQLFAGKFYRCNDDSVSYEWQCTGTFLNEKGIVEQRQWKTPLSNFDHFGYAELTLAGIMSTEGWSDVMMDGIDAVGVGRQPQRDYAPWNSLFFIAWIVLGTFFMVNLFVGVLIDTYFAISEKSREHGPALLTDAQKKWMEMHRTLWRMSPNRALLEPKQKWRVPLYRLVTHKVFEIFIMACIIINVIIMMIDHYQASDDVLAFIWWSNVVFTSIFAAEALLKITGLGPKAYFSSGWNVFDFTIAIVAVVGLFFETGVGFNIFRIFRVARLARIIKNARAIRTLLKTLVWSIPSLLNVGSLLFLHFFIYAVLGVRLYAKVKHGNALNSNANFETFDAALLLLLRMLTGEAWNTIMYDCMVQEPDCSESEDNCGSPWAPVYFLSFVIIGTFMLLNLFIAVILGNFSLVADDEMNKVSQEDMEHYAEVWEHFDPAATGYIQLDHLPNLLEKLRTPLGVGRRTSKAKMMKLIASLHLKVTHDRNHKAIIEYHETLIALAHRVIGVDIPPEFEQLLESSKPRRTSVIDTLKQKIMMTDEKQYSNPLYKSEQSGSKHPMVHSHSVDDMNARVTQHSASDHTIHHNNNHKGSMPISRSTPALDAMEEQRWTVGEYYACIRVQVAARAFLHHTRAKRRASVVEGSGSTALATIDL